MMLTKERQFLLHKKENLYEMFETIGGIHLLFAQIS